ncbi:hypothetical protein Tco_0285106 [Tanacetum coccineum]
MPVQTDDSLGTDPEMFGSSRIFVAQQPHKSFSLSYGSWEKRHFLMVTEGRVYVAQREGGMERGSLILIFKNKSPSKGKFVGLKESSKRPGLRSQSQKLDVKKQNCTAMSSAGSVVRGLSAKLCSSDVDEDTDLNLFFFQIMALNYNKIALLLRTLRQRIATMNPVQHSRKQ